MFITINTLFNRKLKKLYSQARRKRPEKEVVKKETKTFFPSYLIFCTFIAKKINFDKPIDILGILFLPCVTLPFPCFIYLSHAYQKIHPR